MGQEYRLKSVEKALFILKCFGPDRTEISLAEFIRITGLHKSSVYRVLTNLKEYGFVQTTDEGRYTIGSELRRLGMLWDISGALKRKAGKVLMSLHDLTGETVFLVEYSHGRALCTDRIEASKALKITSQIGSTVPLFKGASGKSIAAYLGEAERSQALGVQQEIYGEIYNETLLHEEFLQIRQSGFACTTGEVDEGVTAFSVPLITEKGQVLGSISIAGPSFRFMDSAIEALQEQVVRQIREIEW